MINRDNFLKQKFSTGFIKKVEGEGVSFDNSIGAPFNSFNGDGKSTQKTTEGYQLIDKTKFVPNQPSITSLEQIENGIKITTLVNTNGYRYVAIPFDNVDNMLGKSYYFSCEANSGDKTLIGAKIYWYTTYDKDNIASLPNLSGTFSIPNDKPEGVTKIRLLLYVSNGATSVPEGTSIEYTNILLTEGTDKKSYEQFTGGQPSPSPDYPQQINSIGDNLEYVKTKLPSEYQEVEYIESHQNQYIDTGVLTSNKIRIECEYSTTYNGINLLFGARQNIDTNGLAFETRYANNRNQYYVAYGRETVQRVTTINNNDGNKHKVILSNEVFTIDNENQAIVRGDFTASFSILLGTFLNNNAPDARMWIGNIYSCKIYDNNNLVRDFVPCYRKSDNVIGMYDLANNIFYTNSGTGDFLKGADISDINLNIDLGEEKLRSIDDVKDELVVDMSTGDYYKVENIGEVILNGTENWREYPAENNDIFYYSNYILVTTNQYVPGLCSHFICSQQYPQKAGQFAFRNEGTGLYFRTNNIPNLDSFKEWLSTNNPSVDYQLATPITKKIGTLSKEDLNKLSSFDGHNNILVNTNLGIMNIRLEYRSKIN